MRDRGFETDVSRSILIDGVEQETLMATKSAFISFDYENDKDVYGSLLAQSADASLAFSITDWSVKEPITEKWKNEVRDRIRRVDLTIVLCGEQTDTAAGVAAEITIIHEEKKSYFLLKGRRRKTCKKPGNALKGDVIHKWTQGNLKKLIAETN